MLMQLPAPIEAGDEVEITAVCDTGERGDLDQRCQNRSRAAPSRTSRARRCDVQRKPDGLGGRDGHGVHAAERVHQLRN